MSRSKSGVYGANIPAWTDDHWKLVERGGFRWALVRSDTGPQMARQCQLQGMQVVVQFVDHFNRGNPRLPGEKAREAVHILEPFMPFASWVVLDNEPNLHQERAGNWWAEEFTRWYRALAAAFRYHDKRCHWRLIMPSFCGGPESNQLYWLHVNRENLLESDAVSAHCYWQDWWQLDHPSYGAQHSLVHQLYPGKRVFILEYANSNPQADPIDKANQYARYVYQLPMWVDAAFAFILGGTEDWATFHLTKKEATALGSLQL